MTGIGARAAFALRLNRRVFYGWVMLAVAAVGLFASGPGQSYTFSVFVTPISESLTLSRTSVSSAYGLATLLAAFGLTYLGRLIDRFGVRRVMTIVGLLLGVAALAFSRVNGLVLLFVGFTAMRFLGQGAMTMAPHNLVAQWFSRKRGRALSLAILGSSASMAAFPPLAQALIDTVGWRQAMATLGLIVWVLVIPLTWLLVQNRPESLGLRPDGEARPEPGEAAGHGEEAEAEARIVGIGLRQALRLPVFWVMAIGAALAPMLNTAMTFHLFSILEEQGLDAQVSAGVFPVLAVSMVVATLVTGWLLDRLPTRVVLSLGLLLLAASMYAMLAAVTPALAVAYAVVFGASSGATMTTSIYIWPTYFGRRFMGSIQGAAKTIGHVGAAVGPMPLGVAYDLLGGYDEALLALSSLPLAFAVLVLLPRPPVLEDAPQPQPAG